MEQLKIIEKVKTIATQDANVSAVFMYGSFTKGEGDQYSDVEFYIFLHQMENFDSLQWVNQIRPVKMFFQNEFGTEVAVFDNLIRGEFHFHTVNDIDVIKTWEGFLSFEYADKMNIVDKEGRLQKVLSSITDIIPERNTEENIQWLAESLINMLIMTGNLLKRGEYAHAQNSFLFIQKYILLLIRIENHSTKHWEAPTKKLEEDIPEEWYKRYQTIVPNLETENLKSSFNASLKICEELFLSLNVPKHLTTIIHEIKA